MFTCDGACSFSYCLASPQFPRQNTDSFNKIWTSPTTSVVSVRYLLATTVLNIRTHFLILTCGSLYVVERKHRPYFGHRTDNPSQNPTDFQTRQPKVRILGFILAATIKYFVLMKNPKLLCLLRGKKTSSRLHVKKLHTLKFEFLLLQNDFE